MKLTSAQNKTLKDFDALSKNILGAVSFGKVKTIRELYGRYNYDTANPLKEFSNLEEKVSVNKFNLVSSLLRQKILDSFVVTDKQKELTELLSINHFNPTWNDADALIESDYIQDTDSIDSLYTSILPPRSSKQTCELRYFQLNAAKEAFWKFVKQGHTADLNIGKTGDGKTFYAGQLIRWFLDSGFLELHQTVSPWQILYVTKASIVEQTKEDLNIHFGIDTIKECYVTNYEQLRSSLGSNMIDQVSVVSGGAATKTFVWRHFVNPLVIVWDECHSLKNKDSTQSQIAQAFNNLKMPTFQIFMSATPFSKVEQAICFAVATKKKFHIGFGEVPISNENFPQIAKKIASPNDINEFDKGAIKRLLKEFSPYITTFKNVRRKFKGILNTLPIDFETEEERLQYKKAWDTYLEEKARIEGSSDGIKNSRFLILVQFLKFRQAASMIKSRYVARRMYEDWCKGFAPVYAVDFKGSVAKTLLYLHNDYNIPRSKISVIWGGDKAFGGHEEKYSKEEIHNVLAACMRGETIEMKVLKEITNQLSFQSAGLGNIPPELDLGPQNPDKRWREIKRFQTGKSEFCFFTFKAGGAGLSLHQNKPTLRPRRQYNAPVYNEMEMIQAEGRTAREGSLSNTEITTLVYRNTIEVPVVQRVMDKRQCSAAVSGHGHAEGTSDNLINKELSAQLEDEMKKIAALLGGASTEDDDELEERAAQTMFDEIEKENEDNEN